MSSRWKLFCYHETWYLLKILFCFYLALCSNYRQLLVKLLYSCCIVPTSGIHFPILNCFHLSFFVLCVKKMCGTLGNWKLFFSVESIYMIYVCPVLSVKTSGRQNRSQFSNTLYILYVECRVLNSFFTSFVYLNSRYCILR